MKYLPIFLFLMLAISCRQARKPVSGSPDDSNLPLDSLVYEQLQAKFDLKFSEIENEYESATDSRKAELNVAYEKVELEMVEAQKQFIKANPGSELCIPILWEIDWSFHSASEYRSYLELVDPAKQNREAYIKLESLIDRMEKVEVGRIAPDFEMNNKEGDPVRLSDLYPQSKYLLVDFWASTCGPCRIENVNIRNAEKMGIDPGHVEMIVLSHGHYDHGNGLQFLSGNKLLCHPACFVKRYRKEGGANLGITLSKDEIESNFALEVSADPLRLTEHLYFLGEIPRINNFEAKSPKYILEGGMPDHLVDDSALACVTDKGVVVISGCAHSGICNVIEHARKVTGVDRVEAVVGGFHLRANNEQTKRTIQYLSDLNIPGIYPSHCTLGPALASFYEAFETKEMLVGLERVWK